ncbi:MAG: S8 family serine peptidase [Pirellulales bacterium]|nr:S8 family serine peptidase [Pirellulales bacterium]
MQPFDERRHPNRVSRFEPIEPRLFLSAKPFAGFVFDDFVEMQASDNPQATVAEVGELGDSPLAWSEYGFTGRGQTVVVIDSGIAYTHVALGGGLGAEYRVVGGFDFTAERDADPYDDGPYGGHGTHVAGTIASRDTANPGIAPGVDLVALRVFDDTGRGEFAWIEEALQWVHTNRSAFENPITTVNLSLGAGWIADTPSDWTILEDDLAQLEADGLFISVAAGNGFVATSSPQLYYPASSPYVVPVASVDGDGDLSYFSQRDPRVIAAPGRNVRSTVPDYLGNRDGIDDDFARFSGTSMAAPYVAGASVLLREAYEFVGVDSVTQDMLYNLMMTTADTVYDPVTGADYQRLNLDRALDAIIPQDDFGSTDAAAHDLGTIGEALSVDGTIETSRDQDWFRFTAAATGSLSISVEGDLSPRWHSSAAASSAGDQGGSALSFDVVAGQTYSVGLATDTGPGRYTLDFQLEPKLDHVDWGIVRQNRFDAQPIDSNGQWFAVTAAADGILTTEAFFSHAEGDVDLELFDANRMLVGSSSGTTDFERLDVTASAGEQFYLHAFVYGRGTNEHVDFRVTNLVSHDARTVYVGGTDRDDSFAFEAGGTHQITVNDVVYQFEAARVDSVLFEGRSGSDSMELTGSDGSDRAEFRVGSVSVCGPGFQVQAGNVETVTVRAGGGSDRAELYDSTGNDTLLATPRLARLSGEGFVFQAEGFDEVCAFAVAGGIDVAKLIDSRGNDTFLANPAAATLSGEGFSNRVVSFEGVHAYAVAGGIDTAMLVDSAGNDRFVADPISGALYGQGFYNRAKHFEGVHAYATAGGIDTALLYGSAGSDKLVVDAMATALYGDGFYNRAKLFEQVHARAEAGGYDQAFIHDSAADDYFRAWTDRGQVSYQGSATWFYGFEYVRALADQGGSNKAEIAAVDYLLRLDGNWR